MNKEDIFDNIKEFTPEEIVAFIQKGIVSEVELENSDNTNGDYDAKVRKQVKELLNNAEPKDWNKAIQLDTIDSYREYLEVYPYGIYREEANKRIDAIYFLEDKKAWEKACAENTIESYLAYLEKYRRGKYRDSANMNIDKIEKEIASKEDKIIWDGVDKKSISAIEEFITEYPDNFYKEEAEEELEKLKKATRRTPTMEALKREIDDILTNRKGQDPEMVVVNLIKTTLKRDINPISIDEFLVELMSDHNFLPAEVIKVLYEQGIILYKDLQIIGINDDFLSLIDSDIRREKFGTPQRRLERIAKSPSTEIYFWGIPSSGKTCALGAILSVANSARIAKTIKTDNKSQGFDYMHVLPLCFDFDNVTVLPEGTPTMATYEMGFDLTDYNGKIHPITCIDFAGELIKCMYKKYAGKGLTAQENQALDTLTNILGGYDAAGKETGNRTDNRKIHFFVVEYGAEKKKYEGLPQDTYLKNAVSYIHESTGIFKSRTDALYLIVTKIDKIKTSSEEKRESLVDNYIHKYYESFYNLLEQICEQNQINGGKVDILPFSLGEVCFQNFCKFDPKYANEIVKIILRRTHPIESGIFGSISKIFKR